MQYNFSLSYDKKICKSFKINILEQYVFPLYFSVNPFFLPIMIDSHVFLKENKRIELNTNFFSLNIKNRFILKNNKLIKNDKISRNLIKYRQFYLKQDKLGIQRVKHPALCIPKFKNHISLNKYLFSKAFNCRTYIYDEHIISFNDSIKEIDFDKKFFLSKSSMQINYKYADFFINKNKNFINLNKILNLIFYSNNISISNFHIPIKKDSAGIQYLNSLFADRIRDLFINKDIINFNVAYHKSFIIYNFPKVSKSIKYLYIDYDSHLANKEKHHTNLFLDNKTIYKKNKEMLLNNLLSISKFLHPIFFYYQKNISIEKYSKPIFLVSLYFNIKLFYKKIYAHVCNLNINKQSKTTLISKSTLNICKNIKKNNIDSSHLNVFNFDNKKIKANDILNVSQNVFKMSLKEGKILLKRDIKYFFTVENINLINKIRNKKIFDNDIFLRKTFYNSKIPENKSFRKNTKDTFLNSYSKSVRVIHYDGDKDLEYDKGAIDELILPHKDYRYSDFLNKLLFDNGEINWKYVKSYDPKNDEYTINFPIENPIDIYADIGREYIDLDINILNNTIHFIKAVWKDNMYKYIAMSADDSLKDIMIKVTEFLNDTYKRNNDFIHAQRCLQLFRWYSEMAILNNCEYVLKFDTKKSSVDYYNKTFGDLENLITLDNMRIGSSYILEPIDKSKTCLITFLNQSDTSEHKLNLQFKLYNINTESSIYIMNRESTPKEIRYGCGMHNINIEYNDRVIVRFTPKDKNQSINIAGITINNITTRGFSIKYKGKFGEINSVMQDLLDRLIVVGEASEELKNKLKNVFPVTIAIDTMAKYFELHHENKAKGKRLTIKK